MTIYMFSARSVVDSAQKRLPKPMLLTDSYREIILATKACKTEFEANNYCMQYPDALRIMPPKGELRVIASRISNKMLDDLILGHISMPEESVLHVQAMAVQHIADPIEFIVNRHKFNGIRLVPCGA